MSRQQLAIPKTLQNSRSTSISYFHNKYVAGEMSNLDEVILYDQENYVHDGRTSLQSMPLSLVLLLYQHG